MNPAQKALLEKRDGWDVGRDPRAVSREELIAAGHEPMSAQKALRARCIDCKAGDVAQVRRCEHLDCPASPFRTGKNPWRAPASEERRVSGRQLAAGMALRQSARLQGLDETHERWAPATTLPAGSYAQAKPFVLGDAACQAAGSKATLSEELRAAGHEPMSAQKALRLRCLDCCCGLPNEVSLCTAVSCPAWPFRTGSSPWRAPASEAQREWGRQLGARMAAGSPEAFQAKEQIAKPGFAATTLPAEPPLRPDPAHSGDLEIVATLSRGIVR